MGILDGFWFWIGKALAEVAVGIGMLLLLALFFGVVIGASAFADWQARKRKESAEREG